MIRFKITRNVILNTKPRHLPSYSMYTILKQIYREPEPNSYFGAMTGYIVLEKPKEYESKYYKRK